MLLCGGRSATSVTVTVCPDAGLLFRSAHSYNTGRTTSVRNVELIMPPITTVASGRWTSAPALVESAIGIKPKAATAAVMSTGRKRVRDPSITAERTSRPSFPQLIKVTDHHDSIEHGDSAQCDETHRRGNTKWHTAQPQRGDSAGHS